MLGFSGFITRDWTTNSHILWTTGDMSLLTPGKMSAASLLSNTGLTFTRSTISTVQISASAIDSSLGVNDAGIGNDGIGHHGLVLQGPTRNLFGVLNDNSPRDLSVSGYWTADGSGTVLTDPTTSPGACPTGVDGTANACTRAQVLSGGFSPFANWGTTVSGRTFSTWQRANTGTLTGQQVWINAANTQPIVNPSLNTTFQRVILALGSHSEQFSAAIDSRDYSGVGGTAPIARDIIVDALQAEYGDIATEVILKGFNDRQSDLISRANAASLVNASRINTYFAFWPKAATTSTIFNNTGSSVSFAYLWFYDTSNYARINLSTLKLEVNCAGTAATSTNAISWAVNDFVEIQVAFGNNVTSIARYRINSGSWIIFGLGTLAPALVLGSNPLYIMSDSSINIFHQRAKTFTVYDNSGGPT